VLMALIFPSSDHREMVRVLTPKVFAASGGVTYCITFFVATTLFMVATSIHNLKYVH
ncbi:MAG: hypothetical protein RLZZ338_4418, partial [Cyanobacteriota bacterium]